MNLHRHKNIKYRSVFYRSLWWHDTSYASTWHSSAVCSSCSAWGRLLLEEVWKQEKAYAGKESVGFPVFRLNCCLCGKPVREWRHSIYHKKKNFGNFVANYCPSVYCNGHPFSVGVKISVLETCSYVDN
jgi:hypothetical protein